MSVDGAPDVNDHLVAERAAARYVSGVALGILAVTLGWFAYIDAPITDRVMRWVVFAVAAGVIATLAGLWGYALTLHPSAATAAGVPRRILRLRRLAMLALAVLVVLMAMGIVATLDVKGADSGAEAEDTAVAI
jgi:hypothetical protein